MSPHRSHRRLRVQFDNQLTVDEGNTGRDRARASAALDAARAVSPGTPTERAVAGGPTPSSREEQQQRLEQQRRRADARAEQQRRDAEQELAQMLRLPGDTRLEILVDVARDEVRFLIRDRRTGELVREVPPDEREPLLEKLREFSGALVDRAL
jgi:uncharacterized FlaG/YvyC family protein